MKIFVGYAFKDSWVKNYAIPLIESHGCQVLTGEEIPGQSIDDGVKKRIEDAYVGVFFYTRVHQLANNAGFKPSDWVVQELQHADTLQKPVILVAESGVSFTGGLSGNRQQYAV